MTGSRCPCHHPARRNPSRASRPRSSFRPLPGPTRALTGRRRRSTPTMYLKRPENSAWTLLDSFDNHQGIHSPAERLLLLRPRLDADKLEGPPQGATKAFREINTADDLLEPRYTVLAGTYIFSWYLKSCGGDVEKALSRYLGRAGRKYVSKVRLCAQDMKKELEKYRKRYGARPPAVPFPRPML